MKRLLIAAALSLALLGVCTVITPRAMAEESCPLSTAVPHNVKVYHTQFAPGSNAEYEYMLAEQHNGLKLAGVFVWFDAGGAYTMYYWQCAE